MSYLNKIQKSIDFIETNLKEDLELVQVARVVAFSPYHFHYVFGATVGETFKEYIRKRRLTEAAYELRRTERRIIDVGMDYHFESQESFTRAFKKMFRVTPGAYRSAHRVPQFYLKKKLSLRELEHRMRGIKLKSKMMKLASFNLVGMEYQGPNDHKGSIGSLWEAYVHRRSEIKNQLETEHEFGYCYATPEMVTNDEMRYVAGVKVKSLKDIPKGMVGIKVPAQKYAVFTHKGSIDKIKDTYNYIYSVWFPKSKYEPADGPDLELYDERFKYGSPESELDLYVPIK